MAERDLKRLGEAIETRRQELGISQEEFARRGHIAIKTVQRIEKGHVDPRAKTWGGLDRGAGWPQGTCRSIAEGAAAPVDAPDLTAAHAGSAHANQPELHNDTERKIWALDALDEDTRWNFILQLRAKDQLHAAQALGQMGGTG